MPGNYGEANSPDPDTRTVDQMFREAQDQPVRHATDDQPPEPVTPVKIDGPKEATQDEAPPQAPRMSPGDQARARIAEKARRTDSEPLEEGNFTDALFGLGHKHRTQTQEEAADTLVEGEKQQAAPKKAPTAKPQAEAPEVPQQPEKTHGNKNVQLLVNHKPIEMPMREVRALLVNEGIEGIDEMPEPLILKSAQMFLAAKDRLQSAKQPAQPAPAEPPPAASPEPPRAPAEEQKPAGMRKVIDEIQFGDPDVAAQLLDQEIQRRADERASSHTLDGQRQLQYRQMMDSIEAVQREYEQKPEFQAVAGNRLFATALKQMSEETMHDTLAQWMSADELRPFDTPEKRGTLYRELKANGLRLPSEADISRKALDATIELLGAASSQNSTQPRNTPVAVNLSPDRQARARTATPQPRASSAVQQPARPLTASDKIAAMRKARGQLVST